MDTTDKLSEEEFASSSNQITMMTTQLGIDFSPIADKLAAEISSKLDDYIDESNIQDVTNELYGIVFHEQIMTYVSACEYYAKTLASLSAKLGVQLSIATVDDVSDNADISQEAIIDSTTALMVAIADNLLNKDEALNSEMSFEDKLRSVILLYLDSAYILGLTDSKNLNYIRNKSEGVEIEKLIPILESIFPKVF